MSESLAELNLCRLWFKTVCFALEKSGCIFTVSLEIKWINKETDQVGSWSSFIRQRRTSWRREKYPEKREGNLRCRWSFEMGEERSWSGQEECALIWWCTAVIPALGRLRQEDCAFELCHLGYIVRWLLGKLGLHFGVCSLINQKIKKGLKRMFKDNFIRV